MADWKSLARGAGTFGRGFLKTYTELEKLKREREKGEREYQSDLAKILFKAQTEAAYREPTTTERYKGAFKEAIRTGGWEELIKEFPLKRGAITKERPFYTPAERAPGFREPTGLISRVKAKFDPRMAVITPETRKVIDNIKTQADLDEFMKDIKAYRSAGVDVNAILEFFGRR